MSTEELRESFLLESLFAEGEVQLVLTDLDRAVVGSIVPLREALALPAPPELRSSFFCERRELGILNTGGAGSVQVDGETHELERCDCLYAGRGSHELRFASREASDPARFYLLSYPAHTDYPTRLARRAAVDPIQLGSREEANERRIYQYIHEGGIRSAQLVMGFTELASGSVWNTMPCHTHARRTEIYTYFGLEEGHRVLHVMGTPQETRNLWVDGWTPVLSPSWSIHSAAGTSSYAFIWGMGGENQAFDDMDAVSLADLR